MALFSIDGVFTWGRFLTLKSLRPTLCSTSTSVFDSCHYLRLNIGSLNVFFPQVLGSTRMNFIFKILSNIHRPKKQLRNNKSPFRKIINCLLRVNGSFTRLVLPLLVNCFVSPTHDRYANSKLYK